MRYYMISVEWRKMAAEPVCLADDEEKGMNWARQKLRERGFLNEEFRCDEYNEHSVQFAGIIPL
jgi:hypothetical protein